jgi:hypothetical protein
METDMAMIAEKKRERVTWTPCTAIIFFVFVITYFDFLITKL